MLRLEGYHLEMASNGAEAVRLASDQAPDLVIMDICMPEMNGFDACRRIKERWSEDFVPIVLLTGLNDTESKVKGLDAGADEYLVKPPAKEELLARVRAMLRIRDLQQKLLLSKQELEETNRKLLEAQQIIQEELARVGSIQRSFLPSRFPHHPDIEFGCFYGPCEFAGGDYFDVIEIGKQHLGLLVADVTGHGTPAAVVMAMTHLLMHSFNKSFHFPSTALKVANEKLNEHLAPTIHITMFYGVLNLDSMRFRYASAGHETMLLYRAAKQEIIPLRTEYGFPLKLVENDDYDEKEIDLEPNDKIILFTDGLVEIRNRQGELFLSERLQELIHKYHPLPAQAFVDAIIAEVKAFHKDESFPDDVTLFVAARRERP